jgi:hypothetical protein
VRTSRYTRVSLGPGALLILAPVIVTAAAVYLAVLAVYAIVWAIVRGIEEIGYWLEARQQPPP